MGEVARAVLLVVLVALVALGGVLLGLALAERFRLAEERKTAPGPPVVPPPPVLDFLGLPSAKSRRWDEQVTEPVVERVVASRPMSAMSVETHLEERTVRIRLRSKEEQPRPYWYGEGRHRAAGEPRCRVTAMTEELPKVEAPRLDWSGHWSTDPTALFPQQDGAR